jgi:hypothetical protein
MALLVHRSYSISFDARSWLPGHSKASLPFAKNSLDALKTMVSETLRQRARFKADFRKNI